MKIPENLSFNKLQSVCRFHLQREKTHKCYCQLLKGKLCNSFNCPRRRKNNWKEIDVKSAEIYSPTQRKDAQNVGRKKRRR